MTSTSSSHVRGGMRRSLWALSGTMGAMAALTLAIPAQAQSAIAVQPNLAPASPVPEGTPVQVYRGVFDNWTPIWIELADMGGGIFVLSVLDGLSGNLNGTETFTLRSNGRRGSACRLESIDGLEITLTGCPTGRDMETLRVTLIDMRSTVRLVAVGAAGALGHGAVAADVSPAETERRCLMPTLARQDYFGGSAGAASVSALRQALVSLRSTDSATSQLTQLRADRWQAIATLRPSAWETQRLASIDEAMNRVVDFRFRARFMQQRQQFEAEMAARPERVQARNRIAQIDATLAAIYEPSRAGEAAAARAVLRQRDVFGAVDRAVDTMIGQSGALNVNRAILIERGLDELAECAAIIGIEPLPENARQSLNRHFARIAQGFPSALDSEISSGLRSTALASRLDEYGRSVGLTFALEDAGHGEVLALANDRVIALANREAAARTAEARAEAAAVQQQAQAAAAAERARLAISRSGAEAPTDGDILEAYVRYLSHITLTTRGATWLRPVPGSRFELRTHGAMGGELFRVRFSMASRSCRRVAAGSYDCSFTIRNSFSNARDGSFESGIIALSDGFFSALSGRNNEGLTGRIQSNNINRLLLSEEVPMTARFTFAGGQFDSAQLRQTVWNNTVIRIPASQR